MDIILLQANTLVTDSSLNNSSSYFPIGVQFLFALGFVGLILGVTHLLDPKGKRPKNCKILRVVSRVWAMPGIRWPSNIS